MSEIRGSWCSMVAAGRRFRRDGDLSWMVKEEEEVRGEVGFSLEGNGAEEWEVGTSAKGVRERGREETRSRGSNL